MKSLNAKLLIKDKQIERLQERNKTLVKNVVDDFSEILNNLEDDLEMDETGEKGYSTYHEVIIAIKTYTLKVTKKKYKKWKGRTICLRCIRR